MALIYSVMLDGKYLEGAGGLALAAEAARVAARAAPGAIACVENQRGDVVARYAVDKRGKLQVWVR
jgi:hypothetical protein